MLRPHGAREGNKAAMVIFEVRDVSLRVTRELEDIQVVWCNAMVARELEEGDRVTIVFEVGVASSRATRGVLHLTISSP
jgi:ABC-type microcin C transport system duplicated ATPase subunit YejF